jgi:hypothetical protein
MSLQKNRVFEPFLVGAVVTTKNNDFFINFFYSELFLDLKVWFKPVGVVLGPK